MKGSRRTGVIVGLVVVVLCSAGIPGRAEAGKIGGKRIKSNAIATKHLKDGSVTSAKIADGTITAADIATGAVGGSEVADGSLTGSDIANGSVTSSDLLEPAGADFSTSAGTINPLTSTSSTTAQRLQTVTVTAPSSGVIIFNASGYFVLNSAGKYARCSVAGPAVTYNTANEVLATSAAAGTFRFPFGITGGIWVSSGSTTLKLVCYKEDTGTAASVWRGQLTAIFVPNRY